MLSTRAYVLPVALTLALAGCRGGGDDVAAGDGVVKGPAVPTRTSGPVKGPAVPTGTATATETATETPTPTASVSRAVRYCAAVERFFDITARVATCAEANELLTSGSDSWERLGSSATDVDRYSCARTDSTSNDITIRCTKGDATVRFSLDTRPAPAPPGSQSKDRDPVKSVGVCEKTAGWDAITVTNVACPEVKHDLKTNTDRLTRARSGATVRLDSNFRCTRVDTSEATDPTVRCVNRDASYHATYVGDPSDAAKDDTVSPCAKTDDWDAITAKGVGCGEVEDELEEYGDELLNAGIDGETELETAYQCKRLDTSEAEAPTVYCVNDDKTYLASYGKPE